MREGQSGGCGGGGGLAINYSTQNAPFYLTHTHPRLFAETSGGRANKASF